ncbi:MAG: hypothetical protein K1W00_00215 [Lachnospiraceae bacterium]
MKINSDIALNEKAEKELKAALETFYRLHKEYHNTNYADDLITLAFNIGMEYGMHVMKLSSTTTFETIKRINHLYFHLRIMCRRKALKMCNQ